LSRLLEISNPLLSSRQQETTAFGRGGMRHLVAGMSPHMGVRKGTTGFARGAPYEQIDPFDGATSVAKGGAGGSGSTPRKP